MGKTEKKVQHCQQCGFRVRGTNHDSGKHHKVGRKVAKK